MKKAELQKEVTPLYRLMAEGEQSLFWHTVVEEINREIALINNIESVTISTLDMHKGMARAYRKVLVIPETLKERAKEG